MKLISWNVNGLRACMKKGFFDFFDGEQADIFCLGETKMQEGQAEVITNGYYQYWNSAEKKGYSGTAVFCKEKPITVKYGLGIEEHDKEGRVITLEFNNFYLVNIYTPNSKRELIRLPYRMHWEDDFREFINGLDKIKPVIICGDLNVAHKDIDLKNPSSNHRNPGFTDEERGKLTELLSSGFSDSYRELYPDKEDVYTWWSYVTKSRATNVGWRIDYFLVSKRLMSEVVDAKVYMDIMGSDHCPVGLIL